MIDLERTPEAKSELFVAAAKTIGSTGMTLILPGQSEETQKTYRRLDGGTIADGDLVLCARVSGSFVVLGKIVTA